MKDRGSTVSEHQENHNPAFNRGVEALLLDIYSIMPSLGTYPFTMIQMERAALNGFSIEPSVLSCWQLMVLRRTDFTGADLMDYVIHTKEYRTIPLDQRDAFLKSHRSKTQDQAAMTEWCERTITLGIGIVMQLARGRGITLEPVEACLPDLDLHFGFHTRHLQAYQLFNLNPYG